MQVPHLRFIVSVIFLFPIVLTITNSFMSQTEIAAHYGKVFSSLTGSRTYIADKVTLKLIPGMVSFSQYSTALIKSPDYLLKFWNSVILVVPIMVFQIMVALAASYAFARCDSKFRSLVFFLYIILMLMPYQVTLVPNYLVANWLKIINTRWSIILPGIFSPYAVFILTKFMKRIPKTDLKPAKLERLREWQIFQKSASLSAAVYLERAVTVFNRLLNMVEQPLICSMIRKVPAFGIPVENKRGDVGLPLRSPHSICATLLDSFIRRLSVEGIHIAAVSRAERYILYFKYSKLYNEE